MSTSERAPLDVWLRIPEEDNPEGEAEAEANTFKTSDGDFVVEWYLNSVGQVSRKWFDTYELATAWLEKEGFQDFSS